MKIGSLTRILAGLILFGFCPSVSTADAEPGRITPLQLKDRLDSPDTVVLDVRVEEDWQGSESKIKGALRADPSKFDDWAGKYAKDDTLVLY
jgi:rhodanese-related sulfurtransferase